MKRTYWLVLPLALTALLSAGCYTKFYRPGMELAGNSPYETLYNRDDSTAIDTTLTRGEYEGESYPGTGWDRWSLWGRPRHYTRWGFDFYNFSPDYYWSYYGYNDYYGTPWWYDWYDPYHGGWWHGGGSGVPGEPPSQRPRGRRDFGSDSPSAQSPSSSSAPAYSPPSNNNPPPSNDSKAGNNNNSKQQSGNDGKRDGKRGR